MLSTVAASGDVVKYYTELHWTTCYSHREFGGSNPRPFGSGLKIPNGRSRVSPGQRPVHFGRHKNAMITLALVGHEA